MDGLTSHFYPPKPIPIPEPMNIDGRGRSRDHEMTTGDMAGETSWGGISSGSDDILMSGTSSSPFYPRSSSSQSIEKLEADFMRDFCCCGITLPTLFDLFKHGEENHFNNYDLKSHSSLPFLRGLTAVHQDTSRYHHGSPLAYHESPAQAARGLSRPTVATPSQQQQQQHQRHRLSVKNLSRLEESDLAGPSPMGTRMTGVVMGSDDGMERRLEGIASVGEGPAGEQARLQKPRVYTEEEWEAWKKTFEILYEANPLREVVRIMKEDHGFYATEKQFKTRISQWHLDKNIKQHEMHAIIRKQYYRRVLEQKESAFRVRGREVAEGKIGRFMRRQKIEMGEGEGSIPVTSPAESTPSVISCYTPRKWGPSSPADPLIIGPQTNCLSSSNTNTTLPLRYSRTTINPTPSSSSSSSTPALAIPSSAASTVVESTTAKTAKASNKFLATWPIVVGPSSTTGAPFGTVVWDRPQGSALSGPLTSRSSAPASSGGMMMAAGLAQGGCPGGSSSVGEGGVGDVGLGAKSWQVEYKVW